MDFARTGGVQQLAQGASLDLRETSGQGFKHVADDDGRRLQPADGRNGLEGMLDDELGQQEISDENTRMIERVHGRESRCTCADPDGSHAGLRIGRDRYQGLVVIDPAFRDVAHVEAIAAQAQVERIATQPRADELEERDESVPLSVRFAQVLRLDRSAPGSL